MDDAKLPDSLEQALSRITELELTRNERYGHVVLALVAGIFGIGLVGLIFTEPNLPWRTTLAFAVMAAIALAWLVYALGMLVRRRPLLANREIVAGRMSMLFSLVFTLGASFVGQAVSHNPFTPAVWDGLILTAIASALLLRAHLRRDSLRALRLRLESELAAASQ